MFRVLKLDRCVISFKRTQPRTARIHLMHFPTLSEAVVLLPLLLLLTTVISMVKIIMGPAECPVSFDIRRRFIAISVLPILCINIVFSKHAFSEWNINTIVRCCV